MRAAKLTGVRDIQIDSVDEPAPPQPDEVTIEITSVGVCGSDLHAFEDGLSGGSLVDAENPLILGHEFAGRVVAVGEGVKDGEGKPLAVGMRVAVDPATPCWECEMCEKGHPNLCLNLAFYGLVPYDGALQDKMIVKGRNCFPMPDSISDAGGALLETLGVAIHAIDLSKIHLGDDVAVLGCGPVGLLIIRLAHLSGVKNLYVFDKFGWRVEQACAWGATQGWTLDDGDPAELIKEATNGRGVDIAIEAAWADESINQAVEMARMGGRVVLVGIPAGHDKVEFRHSAARRKGLTVMMSRRMKHVYPRAIDLVTSGKVNLDEMVSHRFPLEQTAEAYDLNIAYASGLQKVIIEVNK